MRSVLILFSASTCLVFFLGYFDLTNAAYLRRLGLSELFFVILITFMAAFFEKIPSKNSKHDWTMVLMWFAGLSAIVLPHIIQPAHFHGNDYRLFVCASILWSYIPISRIVRTYGFAFSHRFVGVIVGIAILYSVVFIVLFRLGIHEKPYKSNTNYLFPGFYNIRHMGYVFAPFVALSVVYVSKIIKRGKSPYLWVYVAGLPILWSLLLWSGSRAGMLGLVLAFAFSILLSSFYRRNVTKVLIYSLLLGILVEGIYPYTSSVLGFWESLFFNQNYADADAISSGRFTLWKIALGNIRSHPILGHGVEGFGESVRAQTTSVVAQIHNAVLEQIHSGGIFAGIGVCIPIALFYMRLCLRMRDSQDWIFLATFTAITVTLTTSLLNGTLFHYRPLLQTVILFAIASYHLTLPKLGQPTEA
jgi:O-antigen ligase